MSKLFHIVAAGMFAAVAAASFFGLATAAPQMDKAEASACAKTLCLLALF